MLLLCLPFLNIIDPFKQCIHSRVTCVSPGRKTADQPLLLPETASREFDVPGNWCRWSNLQRWCVGRHWPLTLNHVRIKLPVRPFWVPLNGEMTTGQVSGRLLTAFVWNAVSGYNVLCLPVFLKEEPWHFKPILIRFYTTFAVKLNTYTADALKRLFLMFKGKSSSSSSKITNITRIMSDMTFLCNYF